MNIQGRIMITQRRNSLLAAEENGNITLRRSTKLQKAKMAATAPIIAHDLDSYRPDESLFVDSILSQSETEDVERMLAIEGEMTKNIGLEYSQIQGGFVTSTQAIRTAVGKWSNAFF